MLKCVRGSLALLLIGSQLWASGQRESTQLQTVVQTGPTSSIGAVATSPDGQMYALGDLNGLVLVYRTSDNLILHRFISGNEVSSLCFSPDGDSLLVGSRRTISYSLKSEKILEVSDRKYNPLALAYAGKTAFAVIGDLMSPEKGDLYKVFQDTKNEYRSLRSNLGKILVLKSLTKDAVAFGSTSGRLEFLNPLGFTLYARDFGSAVVGFCELPQGFLVALGDGTIRKVDADKETVIRSDLGSPRKVEFFDQGESILVLGHLLEVGRVSDQLRSVPMSVNWRDQWKLPQMSVIPLTSTFVSNVLGDRANPLSSFDRGTLLQQRGESRLLGWDETAEGLPVLVARGNKGIEQFSVDLANMKIKRLDTDERSFWTVGDHGSSGQLRPSNATLAVFDWGNLLNSTRFVDRLAPTADGRTAVAVVMQSNVREYWQIYSTDQGLPPRRLQFFTDAGLAKYGVYTLVMAPEGDRAMVRLDMSDRSTDGSFLLDLKSQSVKQLDKSRIASFTARTTTLLAAESGVEVVDLANGKVLMTQSYSQMESNGFQRNEAEFSPAISPDGTLAALGSTKQVDLFDPKTFKLLHKVRLNVTNDNGGLKFSRDGRYLIRLDNSRVSLIRTDSGKAVHLVLRDDEWVFYSDDGYFEGSRNSGALLALVEGNEAHGVDQFAVRFNRPDYLMERLGTVSSNPELYQFFVSSYRKRLARMGLTEDSGSGLRLPQSSIDGVDRNGQEAVVRVRFRDADRQLTRGTLYVNDVPVGGSDGFALDGSTSTHQETVRLGPGANKIEVSCYNDQGAESLRALQYVEGPPAESTPSLYFLGFGVSHYANPDLNLRYAHKDALDLEQQFRSMGHHGFGSVQTKVFTDNQVTLSAMESARSFLAQAGINDTVVLFIAGHGIYTKESAAPDYYYVAYDTDVSHLETTGIRFQEVENLLQGIPSRKKLFLLDTCNSGEVDSDVPQGVGTEQTGTKARAIRGITVTKVVNPAEGPSRPWLADRNRYVLNDLIRRSGAIVFSSSRGDEYSYETDEAQNGLFTEAILKTLAGVGSKANKSEPSVSVRALIEGVSKLVPTMTGGFQHPGVDKDNLSVTFDFPLPGFTGEEIRSLPESPSVAIDLSVRPRPLALTMRGLPFAQGSVIRFKTGVDEGDDDNQAQVLTAKVGTGGQMNLATEWRVAKGITLQLLTESGKPVELSRGLPNDLARGYVVLAGEDPTALPPEGDRLTIDASATFATLQLNDQSLVGPAFDVTLKLTGLLDAADAEVWVKGALGRNQVLVTPSLPVDENGEGMVDLRIETTSDSLELNTNFYELGSIPLPTEARRLLSTTKHNTVEWNQVAKTLTVNGTKVKL